MITFGDETAVREDANQVRGYAPKGEMNRRRTVGALSSHFQQWLTTALPAQAGPAEVLPQISRTS